MNRPFKKKSDDAKPARTKFVFRKGPPPLRIDGECEATLERLEEVESIYGNRQMRVVFKISDGEYSGRELARYVNVTDDKQQVEYEPHAGNNFGQLVAQLCGVKPDELEDHEIDLDDAIDEPYRLLCTVKTAKSSGKEYTDIVKIIRVAEPAVEKPKQAAKKKPPEPTPSKDAAPTDDVWDSTDDEEDCPF